MLTSSVRKPRSGTILAVTLSLIALVVSMSGIAGARDPAARSGGVRLLTTATGSAAVVADGEQVLVSMQNQAFTQPAGSAIMFITTVESDIPGYGGNDCPAYVAWNQLGGTLFMPDTQIVNLGIWGPRQTFFIPAESSATYYSTMEVGAASATECPFGAGGSYPTFNVQVEVQVWALG